ncbi:MAG: hypothetical protein J0G96_06325 [Flavobacteriia bacterium]|nr:hypothetical protein [Flavobacteriia bacterium]OJX36600.1 MAG: hypothetical protein BGO87_12420 [Flavobacteriia bacterium 40-80]
MKKIIDWYVQLWADAIARQKEGKGQYKMSINESKWYLILGTVTMRTLAISSLSIIIFKRSQPIPLCCTSKETSMFGLFLFFFLPMALFDYFVIFYKDRYKKIQNVNPKRWIVYALVVLIIPGLVYLSTIIFMVLKGKQWIINNIN